MTTRYLLSLQELRSVLTMLVFSWFLVTLLLVASSWAKEEVATTEEDTYRELSVGELLERANRDRTHDFNEPALIGGDIAIKLEADRNADPCTSRGCLWQKWSDGKVYIPYFIANHYFHCGHSYSQHAIFVLPASREMSIIIRGLESFSSISCIRFRPYQDGDYEWLSIESRNGCYSYVGRQGGGQTVSLDRQGCLYHSTVQHELLHAMGFNHEQTRSDRDNHIRVYWENIIDGMAYNFDKINTLNQGTPYDYNSVMQYERYAFSKNNRPTMVPIPDSNVSFGQATQMSKNDIDRLNRLYDC
ncbi:high choriolytic enzyme 1-like isoform X2 [Sparus aurata]|nr:high choriolytic enzyme 1-like isoform X2 [Sparus aurata]